MRVEGNKIYFDKLIDDETGECISVPSWIFSEKNSQGLINLLLQMREMSKKAAALEIKEN